MSTTTQLLSSEQALMVTHGQLQQMTEYRDLPQEDLIHKGVGRFRWSSLSASSSVDRHDVRSVDLPTRGVGVALTMLDPRTSTARRRCNHEYIVFVLRGSGRSMIGQRQVEWQAGDAIYVPAWTWHQHFNPSEEEDAQYLTCDNRPMLRTLGIPAREES